jgi:hypothetical protein
MKVTGLSSPITYAAKGNESKQTYAPGVPFDVGEDEGRALIAAGVAREVRVERREVVVPVDSAEPMDAAAEKPKRAKKKAEFAPPAEE